ncbi:DUF6439 family protein [Myxacorys almedinensis]|uniref:Uncharacterized protein n=1 Tax=Myxacorys almedinensis A TaxID=2690445 RepID=A0A8J8CJ73_9CYAN|nr:DUF6439 family protein [Myxacorys almedinensis]NDJ18364.1 hypothetical protein [Myxacorys almedinensis A]
MSDAPKLERSVISTNSISTSKLSDVSTVELAQALVERLSIGDRDWHRLKSDRKARSREQTVAALMLLLKDQPEEALARLQQAVGWLDRSISAPPCPTHGSRKQPSRVEPSDV